MWWWLTAKPGDRITVGSPQTDWYLGGERSTFPPRFGENYTITWIGKSQTTGQTILRLKEMPQDEHYSPYPFRPVRMNGAGVDMLYAILKNPAKQVQEERK